VIDIALAALCIAAVLGVAGRLERLYLSVPILLVPTGWLVGEQGLNLVTLTPTADIALVITELTLGLLLFADATTVSLRAVLAERDLEARLLSIGLLSSVLLGVVLALAVLPDISLGLALLLAAALAPTDAALGLPVIRNTAIPSRVRQTLNVESGLNDGIVTPIVAFAIAMTIAGDATQENAWIRDALSEIAIAFAIGAAIGSIGGWLLRESMARGFTTRDAAQLAFLGLAVASFFGARNLEGNGFIAAYIGGLTCGRVMRHAAEDAREFTETAGNGLAYAVWLMFGAAIVPVAYDQFSDWRTVIFAILALTVMRMLPVTLATYGLGLRRDTIGVIGWFGPRGLASVVFLLTAFVAFEEAGEPVDLLVGAMGWTIVLSVLLHGVTASPLGSWYGRRLARAPRSIPEFVEWNPPAEPAAAQAGKSR
jgi:sodium/hydrogen antiporter